MLCMERQVGPLDVLTIFSIKLYLLILKPAKKFYKHGLHVRLTQNSQQHDGEHLLDF